MAAPKRRTFPLLAAWSLTLAAAAALIWAGGCADLSKSVDESAVTLMFTATVGGVEANTALVELAVAPVAPASLTLPQRASLTVEEPSGEEGASVTPIAVGTGFRTEEPLVIEDLGRVSVSLSGQSSGSSLLLEDGYDNSMRLSSLSFTFDNIDRGVTNLPSSARIITPLSGGPWTLADFRIEGLPALERTYLTVRFSSGRNITQEEYSTESGVVTFTGFDSNLASDVSSADITFGDEL